MIERNNDINISLDVDKGKTVAPSRSLPHSCSTTPQDTDMSVTVLVSHSNILHIRLSTARTDRERERERERARKKEVSVCGTLLSAVS